MVFVNMSKDVGLSTLEVLEEAHNYNQWIAQTFLPHITPPILEIGSGIGNISKYFLDINPIVFSDKEQDFVKHLQNIFPNKEVVSFRKIDITKKIPKEFHNYFATIIGINVLEHIADDTLALRNLRTGLRKNGRLLLLVPAKKFAFTKLDHKLGHSRRYEKDEIIKKLTQTGYVVESLYFFNIVGLLSWMIRDKIGRSPYLKPYHIKIFDSIVPILRKLETITHPPIGVSLIIIARKV